MRPSRLVTATFVVLVARVDADIHCFSWDFVSPLLGSICTLAPEKYDNTVKRVFDGVEATAKAAATGVENLLKFDLTHNPVAIGWNYMSSDNPDQYIQNTEGDYANVTLGFGEELGNTALMILKLDYWYDAVTCHIKHSAEVAHASSVTTARRRKRALPAAADVAQKIMNNCWTPGFNAVAGPKGFNITEPNQKIGATIADIATLFVPVGGEEAAGGKLATGGFDLAIAGSEDTTRIYSASSDGFSEAQHFASEEEANAVAERLKNDKGYADANCGKCSRIPIQVIERSTFRLNRRGNKLAVCCKVPATRDDEDGPFPWEVLQTGEINEDAAVPTGSDPGLINPFEGHVGDADQPIRGRPGALQVTGDPLDPYFLGDLDTDIESSSSLASDNSWEIDGLPPGVDLADPIDGLDTSPRSSYSSFDYDQTITDALLSTPPDFQAWDIGVDANVAGLQADLAVKNTGVIMWSENLQSIMDSETVLKNFRNLFQVLPETDEWNSLLKVKSTMGGIRKSSWSADWMSTADDRLAPYQDFVRTAVSDAINNVGKLQGWTESDVAARVSEGSLKGNVEFFWTGPTDRSLTSTDPRGLHVGGGIMLFGTGDTPGLVVENQLGSTAANGVSTPELWRVPVEKNSFYCLKAPLWNLEDYAKNMKNIATAHTTYGPEMAADGRVGMILSVFDPTVPR